MSLPEGLLLSWYGDDFTGSSAVMEVLAQAGLSSVLFLDVPTTEALARFPTARAVGIAGTARAQTPTQMNESLPSVFAALARLNALVTHYKICSTLDSSPEIGSIGHAVELALQHFPDAIVPCLVAAPAIRRWQCFGSLFAAASGGVFRLDRHPVMARHPVTPMDEADVITHLSRQTKVPMGLLDVEGLASDASAAFEKLVSAGKRIIALDCVTDQHLENIGSLMWERRGSNLLAFGSQGVEYALVAYWLKAGLLAPALPHQGAGKKRIAVVSGSVSPGTAEQIDQAEAHGFACIALDAGAVAKGGDQAEQALDAVRTAALSAFALGADPLIYTARGPDDPAVRAMRHASVNDRHASDRLGAALGHVLADVLRQTGIRRAVIAGGDTSGLASRQLGIEALTFLAPTVPGAALFKAHAHNAEFDGLEIALKGGQMGPPNYFDQIRAGGGTQNTGRSVQ